MLLLSLAVILLVLNGATAAPACPKTVSPTLCAERYDAAKAWILRSRSVEDLTLAYTKYAQKPDVNHTVQDVGDFVGYDVAMEYDYLTVGLQPILGYSPVILRTVWDASTTQWVTDDIIQVDYFLNASTLWNPTQHKYDINVEGMRYRDWFTFVPGTSLVSYNYGIQDPVGAKIFTFNAQSINAIATCGIIFQACNTSAHGCDQVAGGSCISLTHFNTFFECVSFIQSRIDTPNICPYPLRSNTRDCRALHGMSSFFIPTLHCTHVPPVSPLCRDDCLDGVCANAVANSKCVALWPNIPISYELEYKAVCADGYTGDGLVACVANTCTKNSECPDDLAVCGNKGICECPETYVWDSSAEARRTRKTCVCPPETQEFVTAGKKVCVREGRCLDKSQCPQARRGQPLTVQCAPYGVNPYSPFKTCLCNYGYIGGIEYPCECVAPRREVYSARLEGTVCLAAGECVTNAQCGSNQSCNIPAGGSVGTCVARAH